MIGRLADPRVVLVLQMSCFFSPRCLSGLPCRKETAATCLTSSRLKVTLSAAAAQKCLLGLDSDRCCYSRSFQSNVNFYCSINLGQRKCFLASGGRTTSEAYIRMLAGQKTSCGMSVLTASSPRGCPKVVGIDHPAVMVPREQTTVEQ